MLYLDLTVFRTCIEWEKLNRFVHYWKIRHLYPYLTSLERKINKKRLDAQDMTTWLIDWLTDWPAAEDIVTSWQNDGLTDWPAAEDIFTFMNN